ncbi:MAG: FAD-dependent oxidoreductase [Pseudomonadota bacterium]
MNTSSNDRVLIIGAGHAGGQCAVSLRQKGWKGDIVIVGDEPFPPYQRPPLSKAYLAGALDRDRLLLRPEAFYEQNNIRLIKDKRAISIDRDHQNVTLTDDQVIDYAYLVLATGARVRKLKCPGAELSGVGYVHSIADVDALQKRFHEGAAIVIVGAGYIGLEVAAVAARRGLQATVIELSERVLSRVAGKIVSTFFEELHRSEGVDLRLNESVAAFQGEGAVQSVSLTGGGTMACDMAVIGIGVTPNDELAGASGLAIGDGVIVDEFARTQDPNIYAIGDCTRHPSAYFGDALRLESVHNALEQAKTAAAAICGAPEPYRQVPWFWSDQYDVKLQTVGVCAGRYESEIVRGDVSENSFSVFYMNADKLIGVDSVNAAKDHMVARKLLAGEIPATAEQFADPAFDLKSLL